MIERLRRLLGGRGAEQEDGPEGRGETGTGAPAAPAELEAEERTYERELLRGEAERLDDLRQRQLRYAEHAWRPPAQGGDRRADDEAAASRDRE